MTNQPDSGSRTVGDPLATWTTTHTRTVDGRKWWVEITWESVGGRAVATSAALHAPHGHEITYETWRSAVPIGTALEAGRVEARLRVAEQAADAPFAPARDDDGERIPTVGDLARLADALAVEHPRTSTAAWDHERIAALYNEAVRAGSRRPKVYVRERYGVGPEGRPLTRDDHGRVTGVINYLRGKGLLLPNTSTSNERRNGG